MADGFAKDLAGVDQARRERTQGDAHLSLDLVATVEEKDEELFSLRPAQTPVEVCKDVFRAADLDPRREPKCAQALAQFNRRKESGGLRRTQTAQAAEFAMAEAHEFADASHIAQRRVSHLDGAVATATASHEQCEDFGVAEDPGPMPLKAFPGAIGFQIDARSGGRQIILEHGFSPGTGSGAKVAKAV